MKATFPLNALREAVKAVCSVVPTRTTKNILKSIKLVASSDIAKLSATDSENSIVAHVRGVECQHSGEILLPAAKLSSILAEISGDVVLLDCDDRKVTIKCGRSKFTILTEDPKDFPPTFEFAQENYITVPGSALARMLRRVMIACGDAGERYILDVVNFEHTKSELIISATDTRRLSVDAHQISITGDCSATETNSNGTTTIVKKSTLSSIAGCIKNDPVDIAILPNAVVFRTGDVAFECRTVAGKFPNFRRVTWEPSAAEHKTDIPVAAFNSMLRQSMLTTAEESRGVEFDFKKGSLSVHSQASDVGESDIDMPISSETEYAIYQDPNYTLQATKLMDPATSFTLEMTEGVWLLRSADGWRYVQMSLTKE